MYRSAVSNKLFATQYSIVEGWGYKLHGMLEVRLMPEGDYTPLTLEELVAMLPLCKPNHVPELIEAVQKELSKED